MCVCLLEDFHLLFLEVSESDVGYLVHLIIKCGFQSNSLHAPTSLAKLPRTDLYNIWNDELHQEVYVFSRVLFVS